MPQGPGYPDSTGVVCGLSDLDTPAWEEGGTRLVSPLLQVYSSSAPLRIGYYDTDGYFPLPPCMRRAVHETREALQAAGHEVSTAAVVGGEMSGMAKGCNGLPSSVRRTGRLLLQWSTSISIVRPRK